MSVPSMTGRDCHPMRTTSDMDAWAPSRTTAVCNTLELANFTPALRPGQRFTGLRARVNTTPATTPVTGPPTKGIWDPTHVAAIHTTVAPIRPRAPLATLLPLHP